MFAALHWVSMHPHNDCISGQRILHKSNMHTSSCKESNEICDHQGDVNIKSWQFVFEHCWPVLMRNPFLSKHVKTCVLNPLLSKSWSDNLLFRRADDVTCNIHLTLQHLCIIFVSIGDKTNVANAWFSCSNVKNCTWVHVMSHFKLLLKIVQLEPTFAHLCYSLGDICPK
jgi:hypothetical protein